MNESSAAPVASQMSGALDCRNTEDTSRTNTQKQVGQRFQELPLPLSGITGTLLISSLTRRPVFWWCENKRDSSRHHVPRSV